MSPKQNIVFVIVIVIVFMIVFAACIGKKVHTSMMCDKVSWWRGRTVILTSITISFRSDYNH